MVCQRPLWFSKGDARLQGAGGTYSVSAFSFTLWWTLLNKVLTVRKTLIQLVRLEDAGFDWRVLLFVPGNDWPWLSD